MGMAEKSLIRKFPKRGMFQIGNSQNDRIAGNLKLLNWEIPE